MTCPRSLHYKTTTCPKGFSLAKASRRGRPISGGRLLINETIIESWNMRADNWRWNMYS